MDRSPEARAAMAEATLERARECIAGFLLWHDPAYKPSGSESLEKLLAEAKRFMSADYSS
jgi:hypothetical protein